MHHLMTSSDDITCTSCRGLSEASAMPAFVLLPTPTRLWARLQAGRATTADFFALRDLLDATLRLIGTPGLRSTVEALAEVRHC